MFCYLTFFNIIDTMTFLKQEAPLFFWTLLNILVMPFWSLLKKYNICMTDKILLNKKLAGIFRTVVYADKCLSHGLTFICMEMLAMKPKPRCGN